MSDSDVEEGEKAECEQEDAQSTAVADGIDSDQEVAATEDDSQEDKDAREKAEAQAAERRKAYRLNKVLGATMTSTEGDSTKTRLFVIDISVSGFRATDHRPPAEEECDITIVLVKDQDPFSSRMRVVWVKELTVSGMYQMGCEFVGTSEEELSKLREFIEREKDRAAQASNKKPIRIENPWTML